MREALNDLQGKGGEVIVDQGFYDAGCTQSTITGLSFTGPLLANQFVHDISAGQDTWYGLKPTTLSLISAAGGALTLTKTTGSGSYYVNYKYVDPLGGPHLCPGRASLRGPPTPIRAKAALGGPG